MQSLIKYRLLEAIRDGLAQAAGDEDLSRSLRAEARLRLIRVPDEELWELARLTSSPPEKPVELVYRETKQAIEGHRATASEWISDLAKRPVPDMELLETTLEGV